MNERNEDKRSQGVTTHCLEQENWLKHVPSVNSCHLLSIKLPGLNYWALHISQSLYTLTVAISCKMLKIGFEVLHLQVCCHHVIN